MMEKCIMILGALYLQLEAIASDFMSHQLSVATEFPERLVKTQVADLIPVLNLSVRV